jgi:hypothetical protein
LQTLKKGLIHPILVEEEEEILEEASKSSPLIIIK